jgi:pilus assembly protein Flp/PilA
MALELHRTGSSPVNLWVIHYTGEKQMKDILLKLYIKVQDLLSQDEGQDLVEYALVVALIALAATAGMKGLATAINTAFSTVGTNLSSNIT